jgi:hypothetical protein
MAETRNSVEEGTVSLVTALWIEVCMRIFMATNPKLRVLPIWRGEALDEDNLAMMEQLCEENDFQVLMARVDSSGEVLRVRKYIRENNRDGV